jgi:hypothetical protein
MHSVRKRKRSFEENFGGGLKETTEFQTYWTNISMYKLENLYNLCKDLTIHSCWVGISSFQEQMFVLSVNTFNIFKTSQHVKQYGKFGLSPLILIFTLNI